MKRFINIAGALYVTFALLAAHTSLAKNQEAFESLIDSPAVVAVTERTVLDSPRLYQSDAEANGEDTSANRARNAPTLKSRARNALAPKSQAPCDDCDDCDKTDKSCYTVQLWTASWCAACPAYKAKVKPALLKLGYKVVVKDLDKDSKERPELRFVPSVCIYYKGELLTIMVSPPVAKIDKFVEDRMSDEPDEPDEVPDWDLY